MGVFTGLVFCLLVSTCSAFFFGGPEWNSLKVKWGINPFSSFYSMPRTVEAAVNDGWEKLSDCDVSAPFRGSQYAKDSDLALILLFDVNGIIAGIQTSLSQQDVRDYSESTLKPPFVRHGDRYVVSAYFVDPSIICTTGRTKSQLNDEGTGTNLYIQDSEVPEQSSLIPKDQELMKGTNWTKGRCFYTMGVHYWYQASVDMNCDNFYPVFLMYNGGELNSFGWALKGNLDSSTWEHPPSSSLKLFFKEVPKCLYEQKGRSTLHIYLTRNARLNFC